MEENIRIIVNSIISAKMSTQERLAEIQENMIILLRQNQTISQKLEKIEKENDGKANSTGVLKKKQTLIDINTEVMQNMQKIKVIRHELAKDGQTDLMSDIDWFYKTYLFDQLTFNRQKYSESSKSSRSTSSSESDDSKKKSVERKTKPVKSTKKPVESKTKPVKSKLKSESKISPATSKFQPTISPNNYESFDRHGKEEQLEIQFGQDGDYSAISLRRFIARYKAIKKINMATKLTGWDKPEYRADKIKLAFQEDVFDYVNFESSMSQPWTKDDELIINKLKDRYMSIQAVELSILQFEQRSQGANESLGDFLSQLRHLVGDAYDGDDQAELDRKVAWKFASGVYNDTVRIKLMETGWMLNRKEAKPLEDLLKIAQDSFELLNNVKPKRG